MQLGSQQYRYLECLNHDYWSRQRPNPGQCKVPLMAGVGNVSVRSLGGALYWKRCIWAMHEFKKGQDKASLEIATPFLQNHRFTFEMRKKMGPTIDWVLFYGSGWGKSWGGGYPSLSLNPGPMIEEPEGQEGEDPSYARISGGFQTIQNIRARQVLPQDPIKQPLMPRRCTQWEI